MSYLGKTYQHEKDENFEGFVKSLELPADREEIFINSKPTQRIEKDGDTYTIYTTIPGGLKEIKFQDGVEFEEVVAENHRSQTLFTVSDNTITQVQKFDKGRTLTFKREYSDDKLVVTITSSFWDGTARRYYTAA